MRRSLKYDTIIGAEVLLEYVMLAIVEFTQGTLRIIDFCYLRVLPLVQHAKPLLFSTANAAVGTARVLQFLSAQARQSLPTATRWPRERLLKTGSSEV